MDPALLARSLIDRDEKIQLLQDEMTKLRDSFTKLRDDMGKYTRIAKESKPLPTPINPGASSTMTMMNLYSNQSPAATSPTPMSSRMELPQEQNVKSPTEPFKSFRVSMDEPCYKVLPAAMKRYKINGDWREYALFLKSDKEERELRMEEKPLLIFQQLQKEGLNPIFMLRHVHDPNSQPINTL